jgi:Ser/Thr protein kinase RdoA (MazF antagonist)
LAHTALKWWDLDVKSLKAHSQRENTVFRVVATDGEAYALRIHRHGYHDLAALESEHRWTLDLAAAGLAVPEAITTRDGRAYATVSVPDSDQTRHVGLVRWIGGSTLAESLGARPDAAEVSAVYERLGRLIAEFHLACSEWTPPTGFKRHSWDAQGLMGDQPFWGRFWEIESASDDERAALLAIREKVLEILSELPRDRTVYGMIHADINVDNVLREGDRVSVIDFDDAGFGWHAFDLAVAIWNRMDALNEDDHFDLARDALLSGYQSRRQDSERVVERVPLFLLIRSLMLLRWIQDRPETGYTPMIPMLLELALAQARELGLSQ